MYKCLKLILESTIFIFNNIIYKQIKGNPMGSPLSLPLADIVMIGLENNILGSLKIQPLFYKRYVDNIFAVYSAYVISDFFTFI